VITCNHPHTAKDDHLNLLRSISQNVIRIKHATEMAYDLGGVCCEMYSALWEEAYKRYFDGSTLLTPDMQSLPKLGVI